MHKKSSVRPCEKTQSIVNRVPSYLAYFYWFIWSKICPSPPAVLRASSCFDRPLLVRAARNSSSVERRVARNSNRNGGTTHRRPVFLAPRRDDDEGSSKYGCSFKLFCIRRIAGAFTAL